MHRAGVPIVLSAFLLLGACSDNAPALPPVPEKQEKLTRFEFAIDGMRYAISLPEQAGMREQRDPNSITFDARKGQRQQKIFVLSAAPQRPLQTLDQQHRLRSSGRIVRYRETKDAGGGSGGAMATIEGRFDAGASSLFLYCSDQSESVLFADWCLEHLDTLEIIPASSGNG